MMRNPRPEELLRGGNEPWERKFKGKSRLYQQKLGYADDCMILVRTVEAGERVRRIISQYIQEELKLKVNRQKNKVDMVWNCGVCVSNNANTPEASDASSRVWDAGESYGGYCSNGMPMVENSMLATCKYQYG